MYREDLVEGHREGGRTGVKGRGKVGWEGRRRYCEDLADVKEWGKVGWEGRVRLVMDMKGVDVDVLEFSPSDDVVSDRTFYTYRTAVLYGIRRRTPLWEADR